jgi:FAD/FMN-containing dehydrogenase
VSHELRIERLCHATPEQDFDAFTDPSAFGEALRQDDQGVYVNFLGHDGAARLRDAYPGATWDRLREINGRYDPTNLFRLNQNIPPAT